jgi:HEAT repeat protein
VSIAGIAVFPVRGLALALAMTPVACTPIPKGFDSPEPAARMEAALDAAARGDRDAIPHLIALLDSDDPATRLVAIGSLERLTGQTLGYHYAAPEREREEAVERWVEWYERDADG